MRNESDHTYKFEYAHDNVYGHVISLLENIERPKNGIHLDLGCGWGAVSEIIKEKHGIDYIGLDANSEAINYLTSNGVEAYNFLLSNESENISFIKNVLNGREISSISFIDLLEHVLHPDELIKTVVTLAKEFNAPVVLSVPNFTHDDIVLKLLLNKFDETKSGLLDETHLNIFNEEKLLTLCNKYGLYQVNKKDVILEKSDQNFPEDLITLAEHSSLHQLITNLRKGSGDTGKVNQFVRLFLPSYPSEIQKKDINRPFLSIITRTTGERPQELREVLLCLQGQECTDFEVIVAGHNLSLERQLVVEKIINETPEWIRNKISLLKVNGGNRSTPLNQGFQQAKGQYISILDDDDLVFSNWVEKFKELSKNNFGKILKTVTVKQDYEPINTLFGEKTSMAVSSFSYDYPAEFNFLNMLHHNECPGLCLAFPRSVFHDLGLRFDESINTIEDWDYIMRSAFLCGVASNEAVTSIYRWWKKGESSQTLHNPDEWVENYQYVQNKFNSQYLILPPGNVKKISSLISLSLNKNLNSNQRSNLDESINSIRETAYLLLTSNSWNLTKPLRLVKRVFGKKTCIPNIFTATEDSLEELIVNIYNSKSWKVTKFLRKSTYK